eukprot:212504_1
MSVELTIDAICVYPIKSCGPIILNKKNVSYAFTPEGFEYDRRWMIINSKTKEKMVQSRYPKMALIKLSLTKTHLILKVHGKVCQIKIDEDDDCGDEVAKLLSDFLQINCRLIKNKKNNPDIYPFLAVFQESINLLNEKITKKKNFIKYDYLRFRPNLLLSGTKPFNEENIRYLEYNKSKFICVMNYWRDWCLKVTTHNYENATIDENNEPKNTLSKWKNSEFGIGIKTYSGNKYAKLTVGDTIIAHFKSSKGTHSKL